MTHVRAAFVVVVLLAAGVSPATAQTAAQSGQPPSPPPSDDWVRRPELLGDWGGHRTKLLQNGTKLDLSFTQFFDWVPVGDDDRGFDYGGKFDVKSKSDLSEHAWEGFSVDAHFELRYGDVPLLAGGTLIPTSTALLFPDSDGTEARLSALHGSQVFEQKYVLQFGRFNMLDLYSAHPFTGGEGIDRFMNLSLVAPPVSARTVPPVAEGVIFSVLKGAQPFVTVGLIESTVGGFFENGATFMWTLGLPVKLSQDKPGGISVGGEFSSFEGNSLTQSPWVFIPELGISPAQEQGTWTFNLTVDQYTWMHPNDPTKGMGVFGMLAFSDADPSFIGLQSFVGFGGASPFEGRSRDTWGAAYFYNDLSDDFEDTVEPFFRVRNESGFEFFYNWAATGWSRVSADFQIIDPFAVQSETRIFFAARWKVIF
jgi:porin